MANNEVFQYKQFTVCQKHAAMKVGTDADLLGTLAAGGRHILDIGTGTGIISLMMAQRFPDATIEAIDIDDNAIIDATENFANSPFASRLSRRPESISPPLRGPIFSKSGVSRSSSSNQTVSMT